MELPRNTSRSAIRAGKQQIGLWVSLASPYGAEIVAGSGFDWLLIDGEHSPNDPPLVLGQLQAAAPYPVSTVVRPAWNDKVLIKRYLDIGAQSLLIPYVQTAEEAQAAVAAVRYPTRGVRGVAGMTRASRYGRVDDYLKSAEDELCLLVQIETRRGSTTSRRSRAPTASTASSSDPPTSPRDSATWARSSTPRCSARSRTRSSASARAASPRASSRPTRRPRAATCSGARPSPPSAWTRCSSRARPRSSRSSSKGR